MIAVGVVCGLMVGWFACSMCAQAKIGDLMVAISDMTESRETWRNLAGRHRDRLDKIISERDALLHATRGQFKKRGAQ